MSTRSLIGVLNEDQSIRFIYCHWNGYTRGNGKMLTEHYTQWPKIAALLKLGDISILGTGIGAAHNCRYDCPHDGTSYGTSAYGRDRGETDPDVVKPKTVAGIQEYLLSMDNWDAEYIYLWIGGIWRVDTGDGKWLTITEQLAQEGH